MPSDAMPRAAGMVGCAPVPAARRRRRVRRGAHIRPGRPAAAHRLAGLATDAELHVAATLSDRDAEVVVLLDVLHEAGPLRRHRRPRSVLDIDGAGRGRHRRALPALAATGSAFMEYGWPGRRLRPSSGHRHFLTALEWLLDVVPALDGQEPPPSMFGAHLVSPNALVVVLTPLISPKSAAMLARFARAGRFVVAVDTMPPDLLSAIVRPVSKPAHGAATAVPWLTTDAFTASAARLWRLDRDNTIGELREHGIPVVTWDGPGSLDEVLQQVSRMASTPHAARAGAR